MTGYVKFHRRMLEHPVFGHDGMFRLWSYCIMRANWRDVSAMIPGTLTPITIRRGQFITGREKLHVQLFGANFTGDAIPTSRSLWRWMETLKQLGCVNLENLSNRCTLVTVCNYTTYQGDDDDECPTDVQPTSNQRPADRPTERHTGVQPIDQPASTNKEDKKGKKERRKKEAVSLEDCLKTCEQVQVEISPVWHQWLTYKHQRGDSYTEVGLKSAVTHVRNLVAAHGSSAVGDAILKAMAHNWQGFDFGNTFAKSNQTHKPENPPIIKRFKPHRIGIDP